MLKRLLIALFVLPTAGLFFFIATANASGGSITYVKNHNVWIANSPTGKSIT